MTENEKTVQELANNERREYLKKWRREHADRVKEHNRQYWRKKAMKKLQEQKGGEDDER